MSVATSPATGRRYGVERVCRVWQLPRSSFYFARRALPGHAGGAPPEPRRRGPAPSVDDAALLAAIRADLAGTPFVGEGHRKVWARLRFRDGVRVSRKRVLRLMREHHLLSPRRRPPGEPRAHDGTITTAAPNRRWGTDGARVPTAREGWVWVFVAVEHWNAECVGWHVAKKGDRFAALEPVAMGLRGVVGGVGREVARGLSLRMDHGTQYQSDHFLEQVRYWGIAPSFAFVGEPQTNGVAERFIRTLKEQAIHGRTFETIDDLRAAVGAFVTRYNAEWRVEKNGFLTPNEMRSGAEVPLAA